MQRPAVGSLRTPAARAALSAPARSAATERRHHAPSRRLDRSNLHPHAFSRRSSSMAHSASAPRVDPRFLQDEGTAIFTGNELLVKGALETEGGVHLMTGYPGSPIASFFDTLEAIGPLLEYPRRMRQDGLQRSALHGHGQRRPDGRLPRDHRHEVRRRPRRLRCTGLGVLAGTQTVGGSESGGLVILGDDPWSDSTQVPADSRFIAEHVRLPVLEPGTPQEVKDYVNLAFELGRAGQIYIGYLLTVLMADGGGTVSAGPTTSRPSTCTRRKPLLPRGHRAQARGHRAAPAPHLASRGAAPAVTEPSWTRPASWASTASSTGPARTSTPRSASSPRATPTPCSPTRWARWACSASCPSSSSRWCTPWTRSSSDSSPGSAISSWSSRNDETSSSGRCSKPCSPCGGAASRRRDLRQGAAPGG